MSISNPEIKKLYGLAAGRCSICKINVFDNEVHIGEMAHIIAKSENGTRGGENILGGRNSYNNLILLCANHHLEVDQNPSVYTTTKLHEIKASHEKNISSLFDSPRERSDDLTFLKAFMESVPFTRLIYFIEYLPTSVKLDLCTVGDMYEAICKDNPHLYPLNDQDLQGHFDLFIRNYYDLWAVISGSTNVDGRPHANFSQADEKFILHMERQHLPYEAKVELNIKLEKAKFAFLDSYMKLVSFIKSNYREVNINSY